MRALIILIILALEIQASNDLLKFRKRKKELQDLKESCEQKSEPKRTDCLESYEKKKAKYKEDLDAFKAETDLEAQRRQERQATTKPKDIEEDISGRASSIAEFENFYNSSCKEKVSRCAHALYQLANLNFKNEEDAFRIKQGNYEKEVHRYEDQDQKGPEPVAPTRNHDKSLEYFKTLIRDYPKYSEMDKVYYRMGFIYSIQGQDEKSFEVLTTLVEKYPSSPLTVPAHLRIGEHWLLQRKYQKAIESYEKIPADMGGPEAGLALYHKAECYYNMADFETAAKIYYEYVVRAEKGQIKADLKDEAMEFMAASWADIENGVDIAYKFLKGKGHPWEKDLYYQMGEKNKAHDRLEEARKAYRHLLDIDPNYPMAPVADMSIVQTLEIEKRPDEAQSARLQIVERYRQGSSWERSNTGNKKRMEEAQKAVKMAMFQIPLYYHLKGSKDKDNLDFELLNKAEEYYYKYLERYNEDSWDVFEAHQNLGSLNHVMKQYAKAAKEYSWCSKADVTKYGKMPSDKKKTLLTRGDAAYNSVYMLDLDRENALKSVNNDKEKAYSLPQTQAYFDAVDEYMKDFGKSNSAPDIAYNSALVHYEAKNYTKAIGALKILIQEFPKHKHTSLITRMLGQSLLENGQFAESEQVFTNLLSQTSRTAKEYPSIQLSIASAIFKQADEKAKQGANEEAAQHYLRLVQDYKSSEIADKALFEAGIQFETANNIPRATQTLMRIYKEFPKSELKIKAIMRAASIYMKGEEYKSAGETFLIIRDMFTQDSSAFNSVGWAAEAFEKIPDKSLAARTYESVINHFPGHDKTPAFLYNAGQIYEDTKDFGNAVRVYDVLHDKYPKSSYALEAAFSVPIIQEKQGDYTKAAESYKRFISNYSKDPQKLIRAQLAAGKIYEDRLGKKEEAVNYYSMVEKTYAEKGDGNDIPSAIPAEALYRSGEIYFERVAEIELNSNTKENASRIKKMTNVLQTAVEKFSKSIEMEEQEWTLRSTMRIGDLFMKMAEITGNEKIDTKDRTAWAGKKINLLRGLPGLYEKGRSMYQKNLDLAREQNVQSAWIDSSALKYMETYLLKGIVFEEIGQVLADAPIPDDLSPEEVEEYKEILKDKVYESKQAAKPIYATSLKAAQFYGINNEFKEKIKERLRTIDPEAPELELQELSAEERKVVFVDDVYKANMDRINSIYEDPSMSESAKIKKLKEIEATAKTEIERMSAELKNMDSVKKTN